MKVTHFLSVLLIVMTLSSSPVIADDKEELLKLNNTTRNLIDALVKDGVLSAERAQQLMEDAEQQAVIDARQQEREKAEGESGVVRVPYVPDFVREEIKGEIRSDLHSKVVEEVMSQAKNERWGIPNALPEWTRRFKFSGDIRLRLQGDIYPSNNAALNTAYVDYGEANDNGGFGGSFLNTTENRYRARIRARLGVKAKLTSGVTAALRLATGSEGNPVSTNQTMGNNFGANELVLDRAYVKYDDLDEDGYTWLTSWGGRMPNPFFKTDLVWDSDVNLDGFASTFRYNLAGSDDLFEMERRDRTLFFTLGAFSLDEIEFSDDDKWLFAAQAGIDMIFENQSSFKVGLAFYNYYNIEGKRNPTLQPNLYDTSAPGFVQKGNSMFDISSLSTRERFGLASDYDLLNLTFKYDYASFAPVHLIVTGDYVKNIGYDVDDINARLNGDVMFVNSSFFTDAPENEQTQGYMLKFTIGWPNVTVRYNWQTFFAYKHLERDAVLDAFADSDFHLGGTNAEGWIVGGSYGLVDNSYLTVRYLSADEIEGQSFPLGIDVLQIDLNTKF